MFTTESAICPINEFYLSSDEQGNFKIMEDRFSCDDETQKCKVTVD